MAGHRIRGKKPDPTEAHAKLTLHANPKSWEPRAAPPAYDLWACEQLSLELGRDGGLARRPRSP